MSVLKDNKVGTYILDDAGEPVRERDTIAWGAWLEAAFKDGRKHVGHDTVGPYYISTVFLGVDYAFGEGPPVLWETMIFGVADVGFHGKRYRKELYCERYSSKADALAGHARAVKHAESWPRLRFSAPDSGDPTRPESPPPAATN